MDEIYHIRVVTVVTANDDGTNLANISTQTVQNRISLLNQILYPAHIKFLFDPLTDFIQVNSTLLNLDFTLLEQPNLAGGNWDHEPAVDKESHAKARDEFARNLLGRLVIIYRNRKKITKVTKAGGPLWKIANKNGGDSSSFGYYVNMSASSDDASLAHEIGHYLQLPHTFVEAKNMADAVSIIKSYVEKGHPKREGLLALDGDRDVILDTPPDGSTAVFKTRKSSDVCSIPSKNINVTFSDGSTSKYVLAPDKSLVMSYFKDCPIPQTISEEQARRVRDGLELDIRHELIGLKAGFNYQFKEQYSKTGEQVDEVAIAQVRSGRVVAALRDSDGRLKLITFDLVKSKLVQRGMALAEVGRFISICSVGMNKVVTAMIDDSNRYRIIAWQISESGGIARKQDAYASQPIKDIGIAFLRRALYVNYFVTAFQRLDDTMEVRVWQIFADGHLQQIDKDETGAINSPTTGILTPRLSLTRIGHRSFITPVRNSTGDLKTIHWWENDRSLERINNLYLNEPTVWAIASCEVSRHISVVAVVSNEKQLKLVAYHFHNEEVKVITEGQTATSEQITEVECFRMGTEMVVTAVRTKNDDLKYLLWKVSTSGDHIALLSSHTTNLSFIQKRSCSISRNQFVTLLRKPGNHFQLMLWTLQGLTLSSEPTATSVAELESPLV